MSEFSLDNVNSMYMDVLKEIGNIGAGNATTAIAGMLGTTMKMEVPRVLLMDATKLHEKHHTAGDIVGNLKKYTHYCLFLRTYGISKLCRIH